MNTRYLAILVFFPAAILARGGPITIGPGPVIGQDHAYPANVYHEEFQDWTWDDCHALDKVGGLAGDRFDFNDGYDDSRDLMAFYSRLENGVLYLRLDFYDLKAGAENGYLDFYIAIDSQPGGQSYMPDLTNVQVDPSHPWERCLAVYNSGTTAGTSYKIFDADFNEVDAGYLGSYWNADLDSVELALDEQTVLGGVYDGSSELFFTVMTTKDGTATQAGKSSATDTFFDDGRGFDDGVINGAISSLAHVGRAKWAVIAHGNQSVNKGTDIRPHIFDPTNDFKTGFIRTLDTHDIFNVPINLHLSGSLLMGAEWAVANPQGDPTTQETPLSDGPAFLQRVGQFVDADQTHQPGALIGGVVAEQIMPYFEGPVNRESINLYGQLIQSLWGLTPDDVEVMHVPERVIRSTPTGHSPLDGLTFADIAASPYKAIYLDEVTHYHWWFDSSNTQWSGNGGSEDKPAEHKIHKVNGVYVFLINDREDQQKFANQDGGLTLDTRYTLLDKAMQTDQDQLTLVFDDWEAYAGKSFNITSGEPVANNNQMQYQRNVRWIANHPWIEVVTLKDILHRATDPSDPHYDPGWVIDHGTRTDLSLQTYEWLKHASEQSYDNWYYDQSGGVTGNEQNFYDLVPVLLGPQGDYYTRSLNGDIPYRPTSDAQANSLDAAAGAVFLPSGLRNGDLNTSGTLIHDVWAAINAAPDNRARQLALWKYMAMIYETAWHEEDNGNYANTTYQNFPDPDTTWDGVNRWALQLQNHVRDCGFLVAAALWIDDVKNGRIGADPVLEDADLDYDGQTEPVLKNNQVWAAFDRNGGLCRYAFVYDPARQDGILVIGAAVANPSAPGEEEETGPFANVCSAFKDMNTINDVVVADRPWTVTPHPESGSVEFLYQDGAASVRKTVVLGSGSNRLEATYQVSGLGGPLYTRVGASPNNLDLMFHGQEHLSTSSDSTMRGIVNSQGGQVHVQTVDSGVAFVDSPADAGYRNRNLPLTQQIEVALPDNGTSRFDVALDATGPIPPTPTQGPSPTPTPTAPPPTATLTPTPSPTGGPVTTTTIQLPYLAVPPTLDGTVSAAEYSANGITASLAADNLGQNSFGSGNDIGTLYLANDSDYLYLGFKGFKLDGQPNAFVLFLDTTAGAPGNDSYGIAGTEQLADYGPSSPGTANNQEALSVGLNQTPWPGSDGDVHFSPTGVSFTAEFGLSICGSQNQSLDGLPVDSGTLGLFGFPSPGPTGQATDFWFLGARFQGGAASDLEIAIPFTALQTPLPNHAVQAAYPLGPENPQNRFSLLGFILNGDNGDMSNEFIPPQPQLSGTISNNGESTIRVQGATTQYVLGAPHSPTPTPNPTANPTPSPTGSAEERRAWLMY